MSPDLRALIVALTKLADHHDRQAQRAVQFRIGRPAIVGAAEQRVHQDAARSIRRILTQAHVGELPEPADLEPADDPHTGVVRAPGDERPVDLVAALRDSVAAARDRRLRQIGEHDGDH